MNLTRKREKSTRMRGYALLEVLVSLGFLALAIPLACSVSAQLARQETSIRLREQSRWLIPQAILALQSEPPSEPAYPRWAVVDHGIIRLLPIDQQPETPIKSGEFLLSFPCQHQIVLGLANRAPHQRTTSLTFYRD